MIPGNNFLSTTEYIEILTQTSLIIQECVNIVNNFFATSRYFFPRHSSSAQQILVVIVLTDYINNIIFNVVRLFKKNSQIANKINFVDTYYYVIIIGDV